MHAYMYTYICMHTYACICMHAYICMHTYAYYICIHICMSELTCTLYTHEYTTGTIHIPHIYT